ncbi:MAG: hypothetical protein GF311_28400 [Candidatus Lokiarchaeota archaeon]|nr:hypothetical protein [Candidatus Lokiarchaeota archaeon]
MAKLILTADVHFTEVEPFYSAKLRFFEWLSKQSFNNSGNYFGILGDFGDKSKHTGLVNRKAISILKSLKFKKIFILTGNHDKSKQFGNFLEPLKDLGNVEVIDTPIVNSVEGNNCLWLPHYYRASEDDRLMKDMYENDFNEDSYDFVFYHFPDETEQMFGKFIDISQIKGKKLGGDIHIQSERYIGPPTKTRFTEKGQENRLLSVDLATKKLDSIPLPNFLDYISVNYPNLPVIDSIQFPILDIDGAPSRKYEKEIREKYKGYYIRKITYKEEDGFLQGGGLDLKEAVKDTKKSFLEFSETNKLGNGIREKILTVLK